MSLDLPAANVLIQISSHEASRQQETQRIGRVLRRKLHALPIRLPNETAASAAATAVGDARAFTAVYYSMVSAGTAEEEDAPKRRAFVIEEEGYTFEKFEEECGGSGGGGGGGGGAGGGGSCDRAGGTQLLSAALRASVVPLHAQEEARLLNDILQEPGDDDCSAVADAATDGSSSVVAASPALGAGVLSGWFRAGALPPTEAAVKKSSTKKRVDSKVKLAPKTAVLRPKRKAVAAKKGKEDRDGNSFIRLDTCQGFWRSAAADWGAETDCAFELRLVKESPENAAGSIATCGGVLPAPCEGTYRLRRMAVATNGAVQCCEQLVTDVEFERVEQRGGRWTHHVHSKAAQPGGPHLEGGVDMTTGECELRVVI